MLHLKVPIRSGTSFGEIEYENPLQKSRQDYYSAKLHSVYSSAAETTNVNVPLTFTIQDSGYVSSIDSEEIDSDLSIKDYSRNMANLLSGNLRDRANRRFVNTLKNYSPNIPSATFEEAVDDDIGSRFFKLQLPKRTFLYSNLKAPLNALGYADDQIQYIPNLYEHTDIPREIIENSGALGAYGDLTSIYIVIDNTTESFLPIDSNDGRIKWLEGDTFEDVYFPSKRRERYINTADIPRERVQIRTKRNALPVTLSQKEKEAEIDDGDAKQLKLQKLDLLMQWETRATQTIVGKAGQGKPFNPSDLNPKGGESVMVAKRNYWRKKIVDAIINVTPSAAVPEVIVPMQYFGTDANEFIDPLKTLAERDPKSYVRIGANASLLSFYTTYVAALDQQLKKNPFQSTSLKTSLQRQRNKFSNDHTNLFRVQGETIAEFRQIRQTKRSQVENEPDNDEGEDTSGEDPAGPGGTSGGVIENKNGLETVVETEIKEIIEGSCCTDLDIDNIVDKLEAMALKTTDQKATAEDYTTKAAVQVDQAKERLATAVALYNEFLTTAPSANPPLTLEAVEQYVDRVELFEAQATAVKDAIVEARKNLEGVKQEMSAEKAFFYVDYLKDIINNADVNESVKQKVRDTLPLINEHSASIISSMTTVKDSTVTLKSLEEITKQTCNSITEVVIRLNSVYNQMSQGKVVEYPQPFSVDSNDDNDDGSPPPAKIPKTTANPSSGSSGNPSVPQRPPTQGPSQPPPSSGTSSGVPPPPNPGSSSSQQDKNQNYDERNDPSFVPRKKYSIGYIHFKNEPFVINSTLSVEKNTSPSDISGALMRELGPPLLTNNTLNLAFAPKIFAEAVNGSRRYGLRNERALPYNSTFLQIDLKSRQYENVLRLSTLADSNRKITLYANSAYTKFSDNFDVLNPFENDFSDHFPLLLSPTNAGPFNAYSSVTGEMTSMGIVEKEGRVKNAVEMLMRSSERERFIVNFYNGHNLEKKIFPRDYILYFHFNIEVV